MNSRLLNSRFKNPDSFDLDRYPKTRDPNLRAWNAADEYLITYIRENEDLFNLEDTLIINDQFGALCVCLSDSKPWTWTDSYLSDRARINNFRANNLDLDSKSLRFESQSGLLTIAESDSLKDDSQIPEIFSTIIIRVPKHLSLLEFQLSAIRSKIGKDTQILAAGMTKEIHNSTIALFEKWIGPTTTSLAVKKSRLILPQFSEEVNIEPLKFEKHYLIQSLNDCAEELTICGMPGVFSRDRIDLGTRVLLDNLPPLEQPANLIDLGCGAGVIGAAIAQAYPQINITLTDESRLAIESTLRTFSINNLSKPTVIQTNALDKITKNRYDYVLCNPPFHQQNTQTLSIANRMFRQSSECLKQNGKLLVVANRHLKYGVQLKKYFECVRMLSDDKKFIVWIATNPIGKQA